MFWITCNLVQKVMVVQQQRPLPRSRFSATPSSSPKGPVFYVFTVCYFLHLDTILATLYQKLVATDYFLSFVANYRVVAVADYCLSRHLQVTDVPWSSATASDNMISY